MPSSAPARSIRSPNLRPGWSSARPARASVATHTVAAPACFNVLAAARAVAPVVRMSSTSSTCCSSPLRSSPPERPTHIHPPLPRRQTRLGPGGAQPHQRARRQREFPIRMRPPERAHRIHGQHPRLVESALEHICCGVVAREPQATRSAPRRPASPPLQPAWRPSLRRRMQAVIFERVNRRAHSAPRTAHKRRPFKRRRRHAAGPAKAAPVPGPVGNGSPQRAHAAPSSTEISGPANIADWRMEKGAAGASRKGHRRREARRK